MIMITLTLSRLAEDRLLDFYPFYAYHYFVFIILYVFRQLSSGRPLYC